MPYISATAEIMYAPGDFLFAIIQVVPRPREAVKQMFPSLTVASGG
jgi:hypothetical protein